MKLGTSNRKQTQMAVVLGVLALGACFYFYEEVFATASPAPAAETATTASPMQPVDESAGDARPVEGNAKRAKMSSASLDPTLHMEAMLVSESVEYSGTGRNIFSPNSAPLVAIPKPIATARVTAHPQVVVPCPPNCPPPPPPPPIALKLFGVETTASGTRQACLLHDDNVYLASAGDVLLRRYRVISVDAKSVLVEDLQNSNRQTLPLLAN